MTCIIRLKHDNQIYMGADSAVSVYNTIVQNSNKIVRFDKCLVGFAGAKSIQNQFQESKNIFEGDFGDGHLNKIWLYLQQTTPIGTESEILIANKHNLFWIGNLASWRIVEENFECIGNGAPTARGAMAALESFVKGPKDRIIQALDITSKYCVGVKSPFKLECINYEITNC